MSDSENNYYTASSCGGNTVTGSLSNASLSSQQTSEGSTEGQRSPEAYRARSPKWDASGNIRVSNHNVTLFRILRKFQVKLLRAKRHVEYLGFCYRTGRVPKSLRVRLDPQVPDTNVALIFGWEKAHFDFSRTIVKLLCQYWTKRAEDIRKQQEVLRQELREHSSDEEMDHIERLVALCTLKA